MTTMDIRCMDNMELMRGLPDNYVDLIYCDVLYGTGRKFKDYQDLKPVRGDIEAHYAPRLIEMHRILKSTGSIYLQMDTRINHWMRCLMDDVFGYKNFRNEIAWKYEYGRRNTNFFGRKHDVILLYTKSRLFTWNDKEVRVPHLQTSIDVNFTKIDSDGRKYREATWSNGKQYRYYADEGRKCDDVWDMNSLHQAEEERLDYDTQKPKALIERIVKASSNIGDLVADFYLGSGTTAEVCKDLNRNFIGCDISQRAVNLAIERIR